MKKIAILVLLLALAVPVYAAEYQEYQLAFSKFLPINDVSLPFYLVLWRANLYAPGGGMPEVYGARPCFTSECIVEEKEAIEDDVDRTYVGTYLVNQQIP